MIKLLDLFCGTGGCSRGYELAARELGLHIEITGIDSVVQPRYPYNFINADAVKFMRMHWKSFTHIHASPPCQKFSRSTSGKRKKGFEYIDLLTPVADFLESCPVESVIENVMPAPLRADVILNGQMFGLKVIRARKFQLNNWFMMRPGSPGIRKGATLTGDLMTVVSGGSYEHGGPHKFDHIPGRRKVDKMKYAMGIDWMNQVELGQAIPPAYTKYIGLNWFR
jgi:DNA (cytosine-5)-methyltransferase 1